MGEVRIPDCTDDEVLVRVRAAGVNHTDIRQVAGLYPAPAGTTNILGVEIAGEVVEVGDSVTDWVAGDRICAIIRGGGYAEYATVAAAHALRAPPNLSFTEAAALPEALATSYDNLVLKGGLREDEWALIHGGGSGIGTIATQVAKRLGAMVAVTVGSQGKARRCTALGADIAINYHTEDFVSRGREVTADKGIDVILDIVGGEYLKRNLETLALDGRLVMIGLIGGSTAELDIGLLLARRLSVIGSTIRGRSDEQKQALIEAVAAQIMPWVETGSVTVEVDSTFALEEFGLALETMRQGLHFGKLVLTL